MKIIMCHNHYQQPGGEDLSYAQEVRLIESRGHDVVQYTKHNDEIREMGKLAAALRTIWNGDTHRELRELFRHERPEVVHFTNTFPLISPSAYYAAKEEGVAVVQSLRNYRLLCPGAQFMRDGKVCESCLGKRFAWPGVWHGCYRDSRVGTLVVASMLAFHRMRQTWTEAIDMYYALTELSRAKFVEGGLPADKIAVKPSPTDTWKVPPRSFATRTSSPSNVLTHWLILRHRSSEESQSSPMIRRYFAEQLTST
jgi:hypothetical protein